MSYMNNIKTMPSKYTDTAKPQTPANNQPISGSQLELNPVTQ